MGLSGVHQVCAMLSWPSYFISLSLILSRSLSLSALRPHLSWLRSVLLQMHNVAGIMWNRGGSVYLSKETFFVRLTTLEALLVGSWPVFSHTTVC